MYSRCQVKDCKNPNTHLTCAHKCGSCGDIGHGPTECDYPKKKKIFSQLCIIIDYYDCSVPGCSQPWSHSKEAHVSDFNPIKKCPTCKEKTFVDTIHQIVTGFECMVCLKETSMVVFEKCRHANVCCDCALKI